MPVLYRKYRPQRFEEIVGQGPVIATLRNSVKAGTVSHAYLFTGSRGVGKTSVARILAKAVNCLNPQNGDACGVCEVCTAVAEGNFLDLVEIDAASHTGVENVRELIEHVKFQPSRGTYKVFIIDEVHMLSKPAFNALLKTLEEPPQHAIFVLATTDIHKVPETIISRTQRFDFRKISSTEIVAHLTEIVAKENLPVSKEILELIGQSAQGGLRDAMSLLDKIAALGADMTLAEAQLALGMTSLKLSQQITSLIAQRQTSQIPGLFDELLLNGTDFVILNRDLLEYLRKLLVYKITGTAAGLNVLAEDLTVLEQQTAELKLSEIMHDIRLFLRSYKDLTTAPSPELPLLLSAIEAAGLSEVPLTKPVKAGAATAPPAEAEAGSRLKPLGQSESRKEEVEPSRPDHLSTEATSTANQANAAAEATTEATKVESAQVDDITWEEVVGFWPQVIAKIKSANSPLATLVKNSPLQAVEQGTVTLTVKYLFHKEHLESKKNYAFLTSIIQEICGKRLRLFIKIDKGQPANQLANPVDALSDALKVFGGELVE